MLEGVKQENPPLTVTLVAVFFVALRGVQPRKVFHHVWAFEIHCTSYKLCINKTNGRIPNTGIRIDPSTGIATLTPRVNCHLSKLGLFCFEHYRILHLCTFSCIEKGQYNTDIC